MDYSYHKHISSKHRLFDLKLKEVWKYRDLILLFVRRNFSVSYKQTILGPAWLFIRPLMTSLMSTVVFGRIAGLSTDGIPMLLFYLAGTAIWHFFSSCFTGNANTFTANRHLFGKVYFPRLTIPVSAVISNMIRFGISMILVVALLIYYSVSGAVVPNWGLLPLLPLILIWLGVMGMGCGIIVSGLTTKYRDLSVLVDFGVSLLMYASPVVYPLSQLGEGAIRAAVSFNPVTAPIELFRYIMLGKGTIIPSGIIVSLMFTVAVFLLGVILFNKVERTFMDTV